MYCFSMASNPGRQRQIIACARTYLGTPYQHQGRLKGTGIDCVGLIVGIARECGFFIADRTGYPRLPYRGLIETAAAESMDRILMPEPGCVALVRFRKYPQHAAILTDDDTVIHAYDPIQTHHGRGVCVEHGIDERWRERVHSFWRFRDA